jgi:hypothetical protein
MARTRNPGPVPRLWSAAVALGAFLLYLALCPAVSGDKDSSEFTVVLALLGVAHPTGYPLFTLLGHAWVTMVHALGATWAWAANSWTALGGAVAIYFLQRLALALLPPQRGRFALSLLPVLALALNPIWTYETTLAEVYAWHVAWALGTATLFVDLMRIEQPTVGNAAWWGFVCGIGAAHHATSVFVVVPMSVLLIGRNLKSLRVTHVLAACGAALVPLGSYGLLAWRAQTPGPAVWPMLRPGGLLEHVTGQQYASRLGRFAPSAAQRNLLLWYVWPFLLPGLVCLVLVARRSRAAIGIAVAAALGTVQAFSYGVPDPSSYFLFPMAFGLAAAPAVLASRRGLARTLGVVFAVLSIPWFQTGLARANVMRQLDGLVTSMWRSIPYERAWIFWNDDMSYKLVERQALAGEKPGVVIVNAFVVTNPVPRGRFTQQYGFDPTGGSPEVVEAEVNRKSELPVIHFDPERRSVRLLKKPQG